MEKSLVGVLVLKPNKYTPSILAKQNKGTN